MNSLPEDDQTRGQYPMAEGCLDYFPNALAEVSRISYLGNEKHNPGQPMHWARGISMDHRNKIIRHTVDSRPDDETGIEHAAQAAWRALAHLQEKIERVRGVPMSGASRVADGRQSGEMVPPVVPNPLTGSGALAATMPELHAPRARPYAFWDKNDTEFVCCNADHSIVEVMEPGAGLPQAWYDAGLDSGSGYDIVRKEKRYVD